ncbi:MAG TPA: cytochrome C oxidase subunit IV family protein [Candidatus Polarisedimenticolia bacterium]|nr:cytochrome C oxidase subunit IV family protein [Candidatus Polarisedimenticolia bacterium]
MKGSAAGKEAGGEMSGHVVPVKVYLAVFTTLMVLTASTVAAAFIDLGPFNLPVAIAIATIKATLVILYFMHVRWNTRLIGLALALAVAWLFHLIVGTFGDYLSRGLIPFPGK